jgi:hypothetical protein
MYWKNRRTKRNSNVATRLVCCTLLCDLFLLAYASAATDRLKDLQEHFDKETHAGSKVKALQKLADAQFEAAGKAGQSGDFVTVGLTFEKYRDNVRGAFDVLKKQEPDADRHPGGYRLLELQVRRGIREVAETLITAPGELRPPMEIVRKDLLDMDDELIRLLFPRRSKDPDKNPPAAEPKP